MDVSVMRLTGAPATGPRRSVKPLLTDYLAGRRVPSRIMMATKASAYGLLP